MDKLIDINAYPVKDTLKILLQDKSTKKNIIWATDIYSEYGQGFNDKNQIKLSLFSGMNAFKLLPRISKTLEEQQERTRKKAEVMTPVWLCNKMNNYADEQWFGRKDVFNHENNDNTWTVNEEKIVFDGKRTWKKYVDSRRLEITCGEAPYLVSRYDTTTGELIVPPIHRIGFLDRKLRVVNENTSTEEEWLKWAERTIQSCYGYEYQGDNLLIARINVLLSFYEYFLERWHHDPDKKTLTNIANIISWNIWQMDGLKDTVPLGRPYEENHQMSLFDFLDFENTQLTETTEEAVLCKIYDWRSKKSLLFMDYKKKEERIKSMSKKLFDFCIGNPPYQIEQVSVNSDGSLKNYAPPVYNIFMDAAAEVSKKVELIHPARFLFNAGSTPKAWNEKMLNDEHFKVLKYEPNSAVYFPALSTPIKGGIAITYKDDTQVFGAIHVFAQFPEVNTVSHKVASRSDFVEFSDIVYSRTSYRLTENMHRDNPFARYKENEDGKNIGRLSKGHDYDMSSNIFERIPEIFFDELPNDGNEYIKILGREGSKRVYKYIRRDYVNNVENMGFYKVLVPQANGNGTFGETISKPVVEGPMVGNTETFISIGKFDSSEEAEAVAKYISTKFARTLLSILKVTQNGNKPVWKMIPVQDFSTSSDIDWSKSIHEIDLQLYRKYGLSAEEVAFIETNVKEME